jgi:hypothetical protein
MPERGIFLLFYSLLCIGFVPKKLNLLAIKILGFEIDKYRAVVFQAQ